MPSVFSLTTPRHAQSLVVALIGWCCCLSACNLDRSEQCTQLDELVESKDNALDRSCARDDECFVGELYPGFYVATRSLPDDPEFQAAVDQRGVRCATAGEARRRDIFTSRCTPPVVEEPLGRCTLLYEGVALSSEEAQQTLAAYCECSSDSDCADGLLCASGCECLPACEAGCTSAALCDGWEGFGIGSTVEACVATCEQGTTSDEVQAMMRCLAGAPSCVALEDSCL